MIDFKDALPEFYAEIKAGLVASGNPDLARALAAHKIARQNWNAHHGRIGLVPGPPLPANSNSVQRASKSGVFRWLDVSVSRGTVEVHLDGEDRVAGLEVFNRADVAAALARAGVPEAPIAATI